METIYLRGKEVLLDKSTIDLLDLLNVKLFIAPSEDYVGCYFNKRSMYLHQFLMCPLKGYVVDHLDRNKLNNCLSNLKVVTYSVNIHNRLRAKPLSGYYGIREKILKDGTTSYAVLIANSGITYHRTFSNIESAIRYYDLKALELFESSAVLNNPDTIFSLEELNSLEEESRITSLRGKNSRKLNGDKKGGFSFKAERNRWEVRTWNKDKMKRKYFHTKQEAGDYFKMALLETP